MRARRMRKRVARAVPAMTAVRLEEWVGDEEGRRAVGRGVVT